MNKVKKNKDGSFTVADNAIGEIALSRSSIKHNSVKQIGEALNEAEASAASLKKQGKLRGKDSRTVVKPAQIRTPASEDDVRALNDFTRSINDTLARMSALNFKPNHDQISHSIVGEEALTRKLIDLAASMSSAVKAYADAVKSSSSGFYPTTFKSEMKELSESISQASSGGDIRHLRYFFMNFGQFMTISKLPEIEPGVLASYDDFLRYRTLYGYDKFFNAGVDVQNSRNSLYSMRQDSRGAADITLSYYLHIIPMTPAVKRTLADLGVDEAYLEPLGNWVVDKSKAADEDEHFSSTTFTNCSSMLNAGVAAFPSYSGPDMYAPLINDLITFIKGFCAKSSWVRSFGVDPNTEAEYNGKETNLFNPNLAIKIWMMTALNSVYKVLVEDGLGSFTRYNDSVSRYVNDFKPLSFADMAGIMIDSAIEPGVKLSNAVKSAFSDMGSGLLYNQTVYEFLKKRFAPIVESYTMKGSRRVIGAQEVGDREYRVTIVPELVLPINPYDSQVEWYESNAAAKDLPSADQMDKDRNPYFKTYTMSKVELDKRSGKFKDTSIYHFDNLLSYGLYVISNNNRYNVHTYGYKIVPMAGKENASTIRSAAQLTLRVKSDKPDEFIKYPDGDYGIAGPWVVKKTENLTGSNTDSFMAFDLHASFINRDVIMNYAGNQEFINNFKGVVVTEENSDNPVSDLGLIYRLAIRHTNPIAVRLAATMPWFNANVNFISNFRSRQSKWESFDKYVIKESGMNKSVWTTASACGAPTFKSAASDCGGLSTRDFFRYSFMAHDANNFGIIDNLSVGKFSTLPQYEYDSAKSKYKLMGGYLVNLGNSPAINAERIKEGIMPFDGSVFQPGGGYEASDCKRIRNSVCYNAGTFNTPGDITTRTTVIQAAKAGFFSDPGSYIRISKPVLKIPYSFDGNGRPHFGLKSREVNTFSTIVDITSYEAWSYSVEDGVVSFSPPTSSTPAKLSNLIAGSREAVNNAVANWRQAIADVLWDQYPVAESEKLQYLEPTLVALNYIFREFDNAPAISSESEAVMNGVSLSAAKSAGNELKMLTRWSTSAPFILVSGQNDGSGSDLDAQVLDSNRFCAAHAVGLLTTACEYASDRVTFKVMDVLGLPMASQRYVGTTLYLQKLPHDMNLLVSSYFVKLPHRSKIYVSPVKDIRLSSLPFEHDD